MLLVSLLGLSFLLLSLTSAFLHRSWGRLGVLRPLHRSRAVYVRHGCPHWGFWSLWRARRVHGQDQGEHIFSWQSFVLSTYPVPDIHLNCWRLNVPLHSFSDSVVRVYKQPPPSFYLQPRFFFCTSGSSFSFLHPIS